MGTNRLTYLNHHSNTNGLNFNFSGKEENVKMSLPLFPVARPEGGGGGGGGGGRKRKCQEAADGPVDLSNKKNKDIEEEVEEEGEEEVEGEEEEDVELQAGFNTLIDFR